jgi:hypothetical protein
MKNRLPLCLLLLSSTCLFAQIPSTFEHFYGSTSSNEERANAACFDPNGNLIIAGAASVDQRKLDAVLYRITPTGDVLNTYTFGTTETDEFISVRPVGPNGYIAAGYTQTSTSSFDSRSGFIYRINENGQKVWSYELSSKVYQQVERVISTSDGGFAFLGHIVTDSTYGQDVIWGKLSATGQLLYMKTIQTTGLDLPGDICELTSGNLLVGTSNSIDRIATLRCFTTDGNPVWEKIVTNNAGLQLDKVFVLYPLPDGGVLAGGQSNDGYSELARCDAAGNTSWLINPQNTLASIISIAVTTDGSIAALSGDRLNNTYDGYLYNYNLQSGDLVATTVLADDLSLVSTREVQLLPNGQIIIVGNIRDISMQSEVLLARYDGLATANRIATKRIGTTGNNPEALAYCIRKTKDYGYIMSGYKYLTGSGYIVHLVKTDQHGALQWESDLTLTADSTDYEDCYSIEPLDDSNYMLYSIANSQIVITKVNHNGGQIWSKSYEYGQILPTRAVIRPVQGGGFMGIINTYKPSNTPDFFNTFIRFNDQGDTLWTKSQLSPFGLYQDFLEIPGVGYAVSGRKRINGILKAWLLQTDPDGNILWEKTYSDSTYSSGFYSIKTTPDEGLILAGYVFSSNNYRNYLVCTDNAGNLRWEKHAPDATPGNHRGYQADPTVDGGSYIELSSYTPQQPNLPNYVNRDQSTVYLQNFTLDGTLIWKSKISHYKHPIAYSGFPESDGGYVLCGGGIPPNGTAFNFLLVKTSDLGLVKSVTPIQPSGLSCRLLQNPSKGLVRASINGPETGTFTVHLSDSNGRLIRQTSFEKTGTSYEFSLDQPNLPGGVYWVEVVFQHYRWTGKWVNE